MTNKDVKQKLEEIPIPFRDLKNVVEELRFEDEPTRLRCRGWIVLQSKKFLQANIIFPGSDIDCRLHIRARSGNIVAQLFPSIDMAVSGRVSLPCCVRCMKMTFPGMGSIGVGGGGRERMPCKNVGSARRIA